MIHTDGIFSFPLNTIVVERNSIQKVAASPRRKEPLFQTQTEKISVWLALTVEVIYFSK